MAQVVIDNTVTLKVFRVVAEARSLTLGEILDVWAPEADLRTETRTEIHGSLERLVAAKLVQIEEAPLEDFSIYYVTSEGLLTYRKLEHSGFFEENESAFKLVN